MAPVSLRNWGSTYLAHAGENTVATAAYCAAAVLSVEGWHHLPTAAMAAGYAILGQLASKKAGHNGTASFLSTVVAKK